MLQHALVNALLLQAGRLLWLRLGELLPGSVGIQQLLATGVDDVRWSLMSLLYFQVVAWMSSIWPSVTRWQWSTKFATF